MVARLLVTLFTLIGLAETSEAKVINDELVDNLRCDQISPANIYKAIRADAFENHRRVPMTNFDANGIQQCWALARFQRVGLLLGRTDETVTYDRSRMIETARGARYVSVLGSPVQVRKPLQSLYTFRWPELWSESNWTPTSAYIKDNGVGSGVAPINMQKVIADAQLRLFYRPQNLYLVTSKPSFEEQTKTVLKIFEMTRQNKLPLIVTRTSRVSQHVVIGREITKIAKRHWAISVIDSNNPLETISLHVELGNGKWSFWTKSIVKGEEVQKAKDAIFLVEEQERPMIESALVRHYTKLCRAR